MRLLCCYFGAMLLLASACDEVRDPRPATLRLSCFYHGEPKDCWVKLFKPDGRQLLEAGCNEGRLTLGKLHAGTYILRFYDPGQQAYPAELEVRLYEAGELELTVDLEKPGASARRGSPWP